MRIALVEFSVPLLLRAQVRGPALQPTQDRHPLGQEIAIAKQNGRHPGTLEEQTDVELICHPNTAVHLYGLVRCEDCGVSRFGLGSGDQQTGIIGLVIEGTCRGDHQRAR